MELDVCGLTCAAATNEEHRRVRDIECKASKENITVKPVLQPMVDYRSLSTFIYRVIAYFSYSDRSRMCDNTHCQILITKHGF